MSKKWKFWLMVMWTVLFIVTYLIDASIKALVFSGVCLITSTIEYENVKYRDE